MRWSRWSVVFLLVIGALLAAPEFALGQPVPHTLLLPSTQLWVLLIGALVPGVGYVLNKYAPWVSEPVKAIVHVVLAAAAGACYAAIASHTFGWNASTWELILSAVLSALVAHKVLWLPSGISLLLGGGQNSRLPVAGHTRQRR